MRRSPMVQADSLMSGTCYWPAFMLNLAATGRAQAGITPNPAPVPTARRSGRSGWGACCCTKPAPGALTLINSAKTAAAAARASVLRVAGLSGGTHFAALRITVGCSLSFAGRNNEGALQLVRGLAEAEIDDDDRCVGHP